MTRIRISNQNSGELVLSDQGKGLYCIGKCALQTLVQPGGSATAGRPGRTYGYSIYRIFHPLPVVFAVDLPNGKNVSIMEVTEVAAGVWDAVVYCGDSPDGYGFDTVQYAVDVWAYSYPTGILDPNIGYIKDANNGVAYDFSRPNLLFPRFRGMTNGYNAVGISALNRPVVMGLPTSYTFGDEALPANRWAFASYVNVWRRSGNTLAEVSITKQRWEYSNIEPINDSNSGAANTSFFIIEGDQLP